MSKTKGLYFNNQLYSSGISEAAQALEDINTAINDFENIKKRALATEDETAPIAFDGMYQSTLNSISNTLNSIKADIEDGIKKAETSKIIIDKYNSGQMIEYAALMLLKLSSKNSTTNNDGVYTGELNYTTIYDEGYTPQGITVIDNQILITAYDGSDDKRNSKIFVFNLDDQSKNYSVVLDNKAHVGGITYDKENGVLLIPGKSGEVKAYDYKAIDAFAKNNNNGTNNDFEVKVTDGYQLNSTISANNEYYDTGAKTTNYASSTIYYDEKDNKIYIGRFAKDGKLIYGTPQYNRATGTYEWKTSNVTDLENGVQGIATYHKDGKSYLVLARSYGKNNSQITVKDITNGVENSTVVGTKDLKQPYVEGIDINTNGDAIFVSEKGDSEVRNKTETININDIIEEQNQDTGNIKIKTDDYDKGTEEQSETGYW